MTTSVFYDSQQRGLDMLRQVDAVASGVTASTLYSNLTALLTTGVTQVQSVNNSASTTNPTATFANTPTNGNAMIAIVIRGADNVSSTNGSWTQLTANGSAGARRLEIWWRRAGAGESKTHTWTNATATLWEVTLLEFGGWAAVADPKVLLGAANTTTTTTTTFNPTGILASVCALVTSGGSAGTFTDTATNGESLTNVPVTNTTRFRQFIVDGYTNQPTQTISSTWTTSRPFTRAQVGWANGDTAQVGAIDQYVGTDASTATGYASQVGMSFDTSAIPDANTISSTTLTLQSGTNTSNYPANTAVNIYSLAAASISASNANGPAVWKTPTQLGALTRVATRAAGSAWSTSTAYTWTSDATFPGEVNKTGNTTLLIATADQQSGTTRGTLEIMSLPLSTGVHYLTVVHTFAGTASAAASVTASPTIATVRARIASAAASITAVPVVSRAVAFARTIAASITALPVVQYTVAYAPIGTQAVRTMTLKVKSALALPGQSKIALKVRSILSLKD